MFDGTLDPDLIMVAMELMVDWAVANKGLPYVIHDPASDKSITFSEFEYRRALRILGTEFIHTTQIVLNHLHRKTQGNPSGNVLTVVLNTMVNAMYLRLCWVELAASNDRLHLSLHWFQRYVSDKEYGDDNVISVHPDVQEWFHPGAIAEVLGMKGIEYTTAEKTGEQTLKDVDSLRFLKRGWRRDPVVTTLYHEPIDKDTIYELTNWIRECPDEDEQLIIQVREALSEARAHGFEFYDELRTQANEAFERAEIKHYFVDEFEELCDAWRAELLE